MGNIPDKLSHKSTGKFPTINQPYQQQLVDPSNWSAVQKLVPGTME